MKNILTTNQIKELYPNQWVLIADPQLSETDTHNSYLNRLVKGTVLLANKDKRELAYESKGIDFDNQETICIYTGYVAQNRRFLL